MLGSSMRGLLLTPCEIPQDGCNLHRIMSRKTIHYPGKQRFELKSGPGDPAVISYRKSGDLIVIEHTFVPPAHRGQGIAADITHDALLEARRLGWKIVPDCSYVETYIQRNQEFRDVLYVAGGLN